MKRNQRSGPPPRPRKQSEERSRVRPQPHAPPRPGQSRRALSHKGDDARIKDIQTHFNAQLSQMKLEIARLNRLIEERKPEREASHPKFVQLPPLAGTSAKPPLPQSSRQPEPVSESASEPVSPKKEAVKGTQVQGLLKGVKLQSASLGSNVLKGYLRKNSKGVAVKVCAAASPLLKRQFQLYELIWRNIVKIGDQAFPRALQFVEDYEYHLLVLQQLGPALDTVMGGSGLQTATVLQVGCAVLKILDFLHGLGYLLRNLSPHHLLLNEHCSVSLVDLSMAQKLAAKSQIPSDYYGACSSTAYLTGRAQGKREDVQSLCYLLVLLESGRLPWSDCQSKAEVLRVRERKGLKDLSAGCSPAVRDAIELWSQGCVDCAKLGQALGKGAPGKSEQLQWLK